MSFSLDSQFHQAGFSSSHSMSRFWPLGHYQRIHRGWKVNLGCPLCPRCLPCRSWGSCHRRLSFSILRSPAWSCHCLLSLSSTAPIIHSSTPRIEGSGCLPLELGSRVAVASKENFEILPYRKPGCDLFVAFHFNRWRNYSCCGQALFFSASSRQPMDPLCPVETP